MKALVIGLGSMGKRRIRNLRALGVRDIYGYEQNVAVAAEAKKLHAITLVESLDDVPSIGIDLAVISTPPGAHLPFAKWCAKNHVPFFVELNLITKEARAIERIARTHRVRWFPSNTELFDADIAMLGEHAPRRGYFVFHLGQNIHDWHPWQKPGEHFIFKPETNGMREMLRIELPWMLDLFGPVAGVSARAARIETKKYGIDDYLSVDLRFARGICGTMVLDLLTPQPIKRMEIIGAQKRTIWHERNNLLEVQEGKGKTRTINLKSKKKLAHYAFPEDAHLEEMRHVLRALAGKEKQALTFGKEIEVLRLIDTIERIRRYD